MVLMAGMTAVAPRAAGPIALEDMNRGAGVGYMRRHGAVHYAETGEADASDGPGGSSLDGRGKRDGAATNAAPTPSGSV